jgi:NAD(P)H-flavin reductase/truncated hemoglobin YjbI
VPQEDYFLEVHVKRVPDGIMSNWIFDELSENDELEFHGPKGNSYYVPGERDQPLLLIGTGTGLSPLLGIVRDALASGHSGPVYIYHGSRYPQGLYLQNTLNELAMRHKNLHPNYCVSSDDVPAGFRSGRASDVALAEHAELKGWRVYLCGHPVMVRDTHQAVLDAGAGPLEIHSDPFWGLDDTGDTSTEATDGSEESTPARIRCEERRKYPEPDLELWKALGEGRLLSEVFIDFYNRVYEDPLLSPFFEGITKQRSIEKQYNFMCQVLTGKDVYFGERPRNAHHWMVISGEMFDHREELMESCLRRAGLPEYWIRKFRAIEETYREDIVKDKPWNKILFGKEVPVEGFDEMTLDDATLCDGCHQEVLAGERVQYHVRLGKIYCRLCRIDNDD